MCRQHAQIRIDFWHRRPRVQREYAMREIYKAAGLGKLVCPEGEYLGYSEGPTPSFREWRVGLPPQCYPTHSNFSKNRT
jgi:hypothetical protein